MANKKAAANVKKAPKQQRRYSHVLMKNKSNPSVSVLANKWLKVFFSKKIDTSVGLFSKDMFMNLNYQAPFVR